MQTTVHDKESGQVASAVNCYFMCQVHAHQQLCMLPANTSPSPDRNTPLAHALHKEVYVLIVLLTCVLYNTLPAVLALCNVHYKTHCAQSWSCLLLMSHNRKIAHCRMVQCSRVKWPSARTCTCKSRSAGSLCLILPKRLFCYAGCCNPSAAHYMLYSTPP